MASGSALTAGDLARSPTWLPLEPAGGDAVRLLQLTEADYQAASFLDQRLLAQRRAQASCPVAVLREAAARLTPRAHFIFHIGHAGSTLISRLAGAHAGVFALREPALLRTLATAHAAGAATPDLAMLLALLSRTWRPEQRALVKATSFVSELAGAVLAADYRPVAIFMCVGPLSYLRGILAGPNSRLEIRQLAAARLRRLERRLGTDPPWRPDPGSEGEHIAMSWLCEMTALHQAAQGFAAQVLWSDFDAFLREPHGSLQTIFHALRHEVPAGEVEALVSGPLMRQYSKAPEHAYDAALRAQLLQSADRDHALEIRRGLDWLVRAASRYPLVAAVLEAAAAHAPR